MKSLVLAAALVAVALAAPQDPNQGAQILKQDSEVQPNGYQWAYETSNGITAEEKGTLKSGGAPEEGGIEAQGQFQYTAPDGQVISLLYRADENGFQPQGAHLPTPPPVPADIQRALDYLATLPPNPENNKQ